MGFERPAPAASSIGPDPDPRPLPAPPPCEPRGVVPPPGVLPGDAESAPVKPRKCHGGESSTPPPRGLRPGPAAGPGVRAVPALRGFARSSRQRVVRARQRRREPAPLRSGSGAAIRGEPRRMAGRRERKRRGPGDASGPRGTGEVRRRRRRRRPERTDAEAVYLRRRRRRLRGRASGLPPRSSSAAAPAGAGTPPPSSLAFCSAMASESIPRDPCRCKPPPGEEPSPVATGDAGRPARAGGDAPKPYVAFPAQEFCRNGRFPPPDEGDVPKPKSRRGGHPGRRRRAGRRTRERTGRATRSNGSMGEGGPSGEPRCRRRPRPAAAAAEVSVNHPRRDGRRHAVHPGERARVQKVHRRAQRPTGGRAHRRERVLPKVAAARLFLLDDDGVRRVAPFPPARISCAIAKRSPRHCDCLAALWNLFAGNDLHSACNARTIDGSFVRHRRRLRARPSGFARRRILTMGSIDRRLAAGSLVGVVGVVSQHPPLDQDAGAFPRVLLGGRVAVGPEVGHVHLEDERREAAAVGRPLLGTPRLERLCVRVELDDVQVKLRDASGRNGGWVSPRRMRSGRGRATTRRLSCFSVLQNRTRDGSRGRGGARGTARRTHRFCFPSSDASTIRDCSTTLAHFTNHSDTICAALFAIAAGPFRGGWSVGPRPLVESAPPRGVEGRLAQEPLRVPSLNARVARSARLSSTRRGPSPDPSTETRAPRGSTSGASPEEACLNSRESLPSTSPTDRPRSRRASILCFWANCFPVRVT